MAGVVKTSGVEGNMRNVLMALKLEIKCVMENNATTQIEETGTRIRLL